VKYPYKKLVLPKALAKVENGKLDVKTLVKVKCGGVMFVDAANKFNEMYDAAVKDGIKFKNVGDYRSADAQLKLFKERYRLAEDRDWKDKKKGILLDADRVKRVYNGETWLLRNGFAPCSTPQKSNHGYGLAIDLDVTNKKTLEWLCANAPTYGFYLQSDDPSSREFEAWHWQYCGVGA
jgi:LAS superfamily LD-carboxypeptidase LdcB